MKLKNKFIYGVFLTGLLPFLFGCYENGDILVYAKGIGIQYVDKDGNILYLDKGGSISYFDKNDYFSQMKNWNEDDFLKTCPMEVLSFTDGNGIPVEHKFGIKFGHMFGLGITGKEEQKREYNYIFKFKNPLITGESVEELSVTLKDRGIPDGWYNCQYNGKDIRVYTVEDINPDIHNPQQVIDEEEHFRRWREKLYNGDLVAYGVDGGINVMIPVDIVPK